MKSTTSVNIMIIVALVLGVVVVVETVVLPILEAEAAGCKPGSSGFNASKGRCLKG